MIFIIIIIMIYTVLASLGALSGRHPTAQNHSNPTTPFPVNHMDSQFLGDSTPTSQSNHPPSSPSNPIQQEQLSNTVPPFPTRVPSSASHQTNPEHHINPSPPSQSPPGQNNANPQVTVMIHPYPDHSPPSGQSNYIPVYERASQSSPSQSKPWYERVCGNQTVQHSEDEFHMMSLCVPSYFFASAVAYTSIWAQRPNLNTSIYIQCFLNQTAFTLFLLNHAVFRRTHPPLADFLDRLSVLLIVTSAYLASMPMYPPSFAIIMFLVVILVYIFSLFRRG